MDNKNLNKASFKRITVDPSAGEKINRPSLTFWQDARVRLMHNRGAIFAMITLALLLAMAVAGPWMNQYTYAQQIGENSTELRAHSKLPPRIPGLEKLGMFDGTLKKQISQARLDKTYNEGEYKIVGSIIKEYDNSPDVELMENKEYTYIKNGIEDEYFFFGTDDLSRDLWTRIWSGTRVSLYVGLLAATFDFLIGVTYGSIAGFYGGNIDMVMMRITEVIAGIPYLVVIILFILVFGSGIFSMSMAIAISGWMSMARIVRSQILKLKNQEFLLAARTLGTSNANLIKRHLLPNVVGQIIIVVTFTIPGAIFFEAFLAFIGLGIPAPSASLGSIITDSRAFLQFIPSMVFIPSAVLSILMLSINVFANGLRDALDPRMRNS